MSWVFLWGEKMPLPTAAELTDPNATNTQMKQRLGQLAENVVSKEILDTKVNTLLTDADNLLENTTSIPGYIAKNGTDKNESESSNWRKTDFINVSHGDRIQYSLTATNLVAVIAAYDASQTFLRDLTNEFTLNTPTQESGQIEIDDPSIIYIRLSFTTLVSYSFIRYKFKLNEKLLDLNMISEKTIEDLNGSQNLYSKATVVDNCALINNVTTSYSNWFTTDFIAVTPNQKYITNGASSGSTAGVGIHCYDSSKNFISVGLKQQANEPFTIPSGVSFIRLSFTKPASPAMDKIWVVKGEQYKPDIVVEKVAQFLNDNPVVADQRYNGKTLMTLGDSITDSTSTPFTYPPIVADYFGMTLFDGGWSGRRIRNAFGRTTIASDTNILASHIITIAHGTNDFKLETSLGTIDDSPTPKATLDNATYNATTNQTDGTFYADYKGVIEHILTVNPQARIMLITPIRRTQAAGTGTDTNAKGHKLVDYVNAVKEIAQYYGLPVLDNYNTSGFNTKTIPTWTSDGLHPTKWAQRNVMAQKIIGFIEVN